MPPLDQAGAALGEGTIGPWLTSELLQEYDFPGIPVDQAGGDAFGSAVPSIQAETAAEAGTTMLATDVAAWSAADAVIGTGAAIGGAALAA